MERTLQSIDTARRSRRSTRVAGHNDIELVLLLQIALVVYVLVLLASTMVVVCKRKQNLNLLIKLHNTSYRATLPARAHTSDGRRRSCRCCDNSNNQTRCRQNYWELLRRSCASSLPLHCTQLSPREPRVDLGLGRVQRRLGVCWVRAAHLV